MGGCKNVTLRQSDRKSDRTSRRDRDQEWEPHTTAPVAKMLSRHVPVSPAPWSRTLCQRSPVQPTHVDVKNEKSKQVKAKFTLILSKLFHATLATSNANFPFVMRSRIVLLFVVKIWQSNSSRYPRLNGLWVLPSTVRSCAQETEQGKNVR